MLSRPKSTTVVPDRRDLFEYGINSYYKRVVCRSIQGKIDLGFPNLTERSEHTVNDRLSPRWLIWQNDFWGLFSKLNLLISSPVPSQGVSRYLIIDKHYMYLSFVYF